MNHQNRNRTSSLVENHAKHFKNLLVDLGEDPERDGLLKTPERHIKSMDFLTSGYHTDEGEIIKKALFDVEHQDIVMVRDIEFYSLCEHHVIPFYGKVNVAYVPDKKVIGLSKIPRVIDAIARRLQVQERLTNEIADALMEHLNPFGVAIAIDAYHMCMMMRGVQKQSTYTSTYAMRGIFKENEKRKEFLDLLKN